MNILSILLTFGFRWLLDDFGLAWKWRMYAAVCLLFVLRSFKCLMNLTNVCNVLLTIRCGGSMVNNVSIIHDLSCVFVYFCSIHMYLRHTTEFVDFYFSVSPVVVSGLQHLNSEHFSLCYDLSCVLLTFAASQKWTRKQVSPSYTFSCVCVCVHAFCSLVVLIPRMCGVLI